MCNIMSRDWIQYPQLCFCTFRIFGGIIIILVEGLFEDRQQIRIIGNTALNNQLVDLANGVKNKRENEKKRIKISDQIVGEQGDRSMDYGRGGDVDQLQHQICNVI
ncbi:hypothetical protein J3Q64DRAFT_1701586 [Phycomyces blakesleeanus]|uniref:Uncharacterized protein n=2 Tax=Phycomyces blakesleeanus TaxID=4837 RepID=A0A167KFF4_PHYB8|nr:hypothetical protein PHYBLDRAFT_68348 [Phycomyces blakesleeanus NRRL 1555(-)]OAD67976.1 hypothetical protein PHYBLDRAFT_68348 [Phycomyces blakesleeanus NRRL 1555(-)]|eukprot:XP_018286016.1 hypothetical protein PHYBLDRAFT_68348 [Phycomyces blakesleeanus NRRL 1555(-)]